MLISSHKKYCQLTFAIGNFNLLSGRQPIHLFQLNMYGFHKVNRRKNSYVFEHEFFVENKEEDYCRIKRAKKNRPDGRAKPVKSTEIQINTMVLSQKAPKMAELLQKLVDFNTKNEFDYRKLKSKLDLLSRQVSAKKQRNLRPIIKNIREKILMLEETQRNISTMNWTAFSNCYQDSPTKTEQSEDMFEKQRKIMSAPIFGMKCDENAGFQQVSLNNICSFKSISSFIAFG